jgi:hypothetical protein
MAVASASSVKGEVFCIAVTSCPRLVMMVLKLVVIVWSASYHSHSRQFHCDTHLRCSGKLTEGHRGGHRGKSSVDRARDIGDLLDVGHHLVLGQLSGREAGQHEGGEEKGTEHFWRVIKLWLKVSVKSASRGG